MRTVSEVDSYHIAGRPGAPSSFDEECLMDSRFYPKVEVDVTQLLTELRSLFDSDYEVQVMHVGGSSALQARKSSTFLDITGMSSAVTITITPETAGTRVE